MQRRGYFSVKKLINVMILKDLPADLGKSPEALSLGWLFYYL